MTDFETHSIGTAKELRLSRALANEIKAVCKQFGTGVFPENVISAYNELIAHYEEQMQNEQYQNGI